MKECPYYDYNNTKSNQLSSLHTQIYINMFILLFVTTRERESNNISKRNS